MIKTVQQYNRILSKHILHQQLFTWFNIFTQTIITFSTTSTHRQILFRDMKDLHLLKGGKETIKSIGIITGGAASEVKAAAKEGIDTFITGEGAHHTFTLAEELGVNLIYTGHYQSETFGVKKIATHIGKRFKIKNTFIDHPTGL